MKKEERAFKVTSALSLFEKKSEISKFRAKTGCGLFWIPDLKFEFFSEFRHY